MKRSTLPRLSLHAAVLLALWVGRADGAVVISMNAAGERSVEVNASPLQTIHFYLSGSDNDVIEGLVMNFNLPAEVSVLSAAVGGVSPGVGNGLYGDGRWVLSTVTPFPTATSPNVNVNQTFALAEVLPGSPARWFSLDLDTSRLATGIYEIGLDTNDGGFFRIVGTDVVSLPIAPGALTLNVTAIPEPATLSSLAALTAVALVRRRRNRGIS